MDSISLDTIQLINASMAWDYRVIPFSREENLLFFYTDGKDSRALKTELEILTGLQVQLEIVTSDNLEKLLTRYYPSGGTTCKEHLNLSDDFLIQIIDEAKMLGSSDVHIEVYDERCRVRFRVDGKLIERYSVQRDEYPVLVNKIKIKANLDIAEKRLPQDGRINYKSDQGHFDIRVSVLPTLDGEKIVLRLLTKTVGDIGINQLGFTGVQLQSYKRAISKPNGIILISGPTGSGKTTTLYATLREMNEEWRNVVTIEDPIEYTLEGINQVQLKESIGLSYSVALKTFLRQDPDVIMLGEIRDAETAQMAIRAALTGHLVFSTIHTNSAWGTVTRLLDMGIPPYLLASTLNISIAQRLVRLLCPDCKRKIYRGHGDAELEQYLEDSILEYCVPVGCKGCYYTGYKGRKAVYEIVLADNEIRDCIKKRGEGADILLQTKGSILLKDCMMELVREGLTSPDEIVSYLII